VTRNDPVAVYHRGGRGEARGRVAAPGLPGRCDAAVAAVLRITDRSASVRDAVTPLLQRRGWATLPKPRQPVPVGTVPRTGRRSGIVARVGSIEPACLP
jgi:hypothetical protein